MQVGAEFEETLLLPRAFIPLELQKNFLGLRSVPLFYASYCRKLSGQEKVQNRVMIATLDHLYCCHPNGDILRCFPFPFISKIIHDPHRKQIGIVVPSEYDLLIAMQDTFHFIHVVQTLRTLHGCEESLIIEVIRRNKPRQVRSASPSSQMLKVSSVASPSSAISRKSRPPEPNWKQRLLMKILRRPPPHVIVGWNDQFVDDEDDGSGQNVVGCENEVCIGKGYYALHLQKPADFVLSLHNVVTDVGW
jgi:hypothetical protein